MLDGMYVVEVDTLMGRELGQLFLKTEGDIVYMSVDAPVLGKQRFEGRAHGNTFVIEGAWKLLVLGKVEYRVNGTLYGDDLALDIKTSKGDTRAVGIRI